MLVTFDAPEDFTGYADYTFGFILKNDDGEHGKGNHHGHRRGSSLPTGMGMVVATATETGMVMAAATAMGLEGSTDTKRRLSTARLAC